MKCAYNARIPIGDPNQKKKKKQIKVIYGSTMKLTRQMRESVGLVKKVSKSQVNRCIEISLIRRYMPAWATLSVLVLPRESRK